MAKKPTLEQRMAALRSADPTTPEGLALVRAGLEDKVGALVALAMNHVTGANLHGLESLISAAFARLLEDPVQRDPGCRGKVAIARGLDALVLWDDVVFTTGIHHVQREEWIGPGQRLGDIAGELRGVCGLAHARFQRSDALDVLAEMLRDELRIARLAAAQAIGAAQALATFKEDPAVVAAVGPSRPSATRRRAPRSCRRSGTRTGSHD